MFKQIGKTGMSVVGNGVGKFKAMWGGRWHMKLLKFILFCMFIVGAVLLNQSEQKYGSDKEDTVKIGCSLLCIGLVGLLFFFFTAKPRN